MTETITGKDTNPFSEGHETKPYLGGRKTEVLGVKTIAFLRGTAEKHHPTIIDRAESRRPESQRRRGVSDQINQRLVSP